MLQRMRTYKRREAQPVGQRILSNYSFLKRLCHTRSDRKRTKLLSGANTEELLAIVEICCNILRGQFRLSRRQTEKLVPFAPTVRKLSHARSENGARRTIISTQTGGGLFASLLTPVLISAAQHLIQKVADGK
ncbi:MAG: hypothetical protein ACTHJ4_06040 [Candidatus Nucleicultricaceae bacterium]